MIEKVTRQTVPEPAPVVLEALHADAQLGRDFNGSTLYSERISFLDENGYTGSRRELMLRLLATCNRVRNEVRSEEAKR